MSESEEKIHHDCMNRFIELANGMKDDQVDINVVSSALMTATAVYCTYAAAGNEGGLNTSGVDKMITEFRTRLERVQAAKKAQS